VVVDNRTWPEGMRFPDGTNEPGAISAFFSTTAPSKMTEPVPIFEPSSTLQAWRMAPLSVYT